MITLGEKLKQARLSKSISQEYMADKLEVSQKTYSNFENDKTTPSFAQIEKISELLEVSILDFTKNDKMTFYQNNTGTNNGYVINNLPEKLIEQYELRIKKLEEENQYLKNLLDKMLK